MHVTAVTGYMTSGTTRKTTRRHTYNVYNRPRRVALIDILN